MSPAEIQALARLAGSMDYYRLLRTERTASLKEIMDRMLVAASQPPIEPVTVARSTAECKQNILTGTMFL